MRIVNHDNYALIGRFLGRRDIQKEIGYPVFNDDGDIWLVSTYGFCSFTPGEIKYLWVEREFRMCGHAKSLAESAMSMYGGDWRVRANHSSKKLFINLGYLPVSSTKNFTLMRRLSCQNEN